MGENSIVHVQHCIDSWSSFTSARADAKVNKSEGLRAGKISRDARTWVVPERNGDDGVQRHQNHACNPVAGECEVRVSNAQRGVWSGDAST